MSSYERLCKCAGSPGGKALFEGFVAVRHKMHLAERCMRPLRCGSECKGGSQGFVALSVLSSRPGGGAGRTRRS